GTEPRVIETDGVIPLDRDEGRDRAGRRVEEPQPGSAALDERGRDAPEERLHPGVHEARLPASRAAVEVEEVAEPVLDLGGVARARGPRLGRLALEPSHLPEQLVTVLAVEGRQVRVPRGREDQDRTSLF